MGRSSSRRSVSDTALGLSWKLAIPHICNPNAKTSQCRWIMLIDGPITRRRLLAIAAASTGIGRCADDFWNAKQPAEWSPGDIYRLTNHSPWALSIDWLETSMHGPDNGPTAASDVPVLQGGGRKGGGGARRGGSPLNSGPRRKAVVTWESAQAIRDARKTQTSTDTDSYVIGLGGILPNGFSSDDLLRYAFLRSSGKPKWNVRASSAREVIRTSSVYDFLFPKASAPIDPHLAEVIFEVDIRVTQDASSLRWLLQAKFKPKEMLYRGRLAV